MKLSVFRDTQRKHYSSHTRLRDVLGPWWYAPDTTPTVKRVRLSLLLGIFKYLQNKYMQSIMQLFVGGVKI
jgi:hypothetical protein